MTSTTSTSPYGVQSPSTAVPATTTALSAEVAARVQQALASQAPGINKLNDTLLRNQTKLSGLGKLQSALAEFQAIAQGLSGAGMSTSATSTSDKVATATATAGGKPGTFAIDVKQLAQGQVLTSDKFASTSSHIGGGAATSVKIEFGTAGASGFEPGRAGSKTLMIDASNNTPDGIAAALKGAGIDAKVVKNGSGYTLTIAGATGAANSMRISVSGDRAVKDLLAYTPGGTQGLHQTVAAQDAVLSIDGKSMTSATNTVSSGIAGASLTLTGSGSGSVVIAQDASQIGKNAKALVAAFNSLNQKMRALQAGELKSDPALAQANAQISQLLKAGAGEFSSAALNAAGITLQSDGNLKLDEAKLSAALAADSSAVSKLFTNDGKGLADGLAGKLVKLTAKESTIGREAASASKEFTNTVAKRAAVTKALTAQATALAALYTQQSQSQSGNPTSLFDILA